MNIIVLLIGLALLGLAGALFVRAVSFARVRAVGTLGQIDSYGYATSATADGPARTSLWVTRPSPWRAARCWRTALTVIPRVVANSSARASP